MRVLLYALVAFGGITVVYFGLMRPWHLRWGATLDERRRILPGDDWVVRPRTGSTRAITIRAPIRAVWPWLAQLGQGRGGLYSYDWLENLFGCDVHSADAVLPEFQHVAVGDTIRLVREGYPADLFFEVALVHPERALVLKAPGEPEDILAAGMAYTTWAFVLERLPGGDTRLLSRWRTDFRPTPRGYFWWKFGPSELVQFVMERKMLKGIRKRAEQTYRGGNRRSREQRDA